MDNESEVIRHQMEETRASLSEKIETLENQVVGTVQGATAAVSETVESVKEAVQETVSTVQESVQNTLDIGHHVDRHPWAMMGGSVALGYLAGCLLGRATSDQARGTQLVSRGDFSNVDWPAADEANGRPSHRSSNGANGKTVAPEVKAPEKNVLLETFGPEIQKLKGLALGTLLGVVRDLVSEAAPEQLRPQLADVVDSITVKLGGDPIRGPLLKSEEPIRPSDQGERYEERDPAEMGRPMGAVYRSSQATVGTIHGR